MTRIARIALRISLLLLLHVGAAFAELPDFVTHADPATRWVKTSDGSSRGARVLEIELTSQTWRGSPWRHPLTIIRPESVRHPDLALLVVSGDARRSFVDEAALATAAGVPVAVLRNVPNQPLFGQSEDELVSHTFEQYVWSEDPTWPLLFPMTKAALAAMDAVTDVARREWGGDVRRFVVSGASKRGWTAWLAAAADRRVAGVVPVVFDNLSFPDQMKNQIAIWGRYSEMLGDYTERKLQAMIGTERGRKLVSMVDPFAYRDVLARVPKLIVSGTNDPYWELDAVNIGWAGLAGQKSLLYAPNAGHDAGSDDRVAGTIATFVERTAVSRPLPDLRLEGASPTTVVVRSNEHPQQVRVWRAESPSRDFRRARWKSTAARAGDGGFTAELAPPDGGYVATFGEAEYAANGTKLTLSTPVEIVPIAPR